MRKIILDNYSTEAPPMMGQSFMEAQSTGASQPWKLGSLLKVCLSASKAQKLISRGPTIHKGSIHLGLPIIFPLPPPSPLPKNLNFDSFENQNLKTILDLSIYRRLYVFKLSSWIRKFEFKFVSLDWSIFQSIPPLLNTVNKIFSSAILHTKAFKS